MKGYGCMMNNIFQLHMMYTSIADKVATPSQSRTILISMN